MSGGNGMIYIGVAKSDFDNWAYNGAAGWSYDCYVDRPGLVPGRST